MDLLSPEDVEEEDGESEGTSLISSGAGRPRGAVGKAKRGREKLRFMAAARERKRNAQKGGKKKNNEFEKREKLRPNTNKQSPGGLSLSLHFVVTFCCRWCCFIFR